MTIIVVGVDERPQSEDAVALARSLALASGAELLLASAVPPPAGDGHNGALRRIAERLGDVVPVRTETAVDPHPARLLQELAAREEAALIVVGSSHIGRIGRILPGSTGERLLHGAPCAVAVAPKAYRQRAQDGPERIGVAYDGSPAATAAVGAATTLARAFGAPLLVVMVAHVEMFGTPALVSGPGYVVTRRELDHSLRTHLHELVARLPAEVSARERLLAGDPATELACLSERLGILVAGSRGYGPLRAVLLGGVTGRLLREAACPVIVTPRGVEEPLAGLFAPAAAETAPAA